jgi:hypothetical protein
VSISFGHEWHDGFSVTDFLLSFTTCSAHLIAIVIPSVDDLPADSNDAVESWFVDQVYAMTKAKNKIKVLPKKIEADPPDAVAKAMSEYLQKVGAANDQHHRYHEKAAATTVTGIQIKITGTPTSDPTNYQHTYGTQYFQPLVVNYVGRTTDVRARRQFGNIHNREANLEGYGICFSNADSARAVQIIMDVVLISEEILDEEDGDERFEKEKHLTPLEESLDQSIAAANSVLREMQYMEKREQRMRKTAESINNRVRWFSYLSVSVLLTVTYIQVTYLKRYFHKKKLM